MVEAAVKVVENINVILDVLTDTPIRITITMFTGITTNAALLTIGPTHRLILKVEVLFVNQGSPDLSMVLVMSVVKLVIILGLALNLLKFATCIKSC